MRILRVLEFAMANQMMRIQLRDSKYELHLCKSHCESFALLQIQYENRIHNGIRNYANPIANPRIRILGIHICESQDSQICIFTNPADLRIRIRESLLYDYHTQEKYEIRNKNVRFREFWICIIHESYDSHDSHFRNFTIRIANLLMLLLLPS